MSAEKPTVYPDNPRFGSGPCTKRPGWSLEALSKAALGRSHRSKLGKGKLRECVDLSHNLLNLPADYRVGIVAGSDTGAMEMAMWSMLGPRGVDVFGWESFGKGWINDIVKELKLDDVRPFTADYGQLPDFSVVDGSRDVVFTWNGTTSGVCVPNGDWIPDDREGLVFCDATSGVFAMDLPFEKLDVITYSWQKVLGGEAAHGVLVLSPRAVARIESYTPSWPMPKIFRMKKGDSLNEAIFVGSTINTPSMLCVEDALDAMYWGKTLGGYEALVARSRDNLQAVEEWVAKTEWIDFLAKDPTIRSCTSICLMFTDPAVASLDKDSRSKFSKRVAGLLAEEGAAHDIASYRDAPPGLRIWGGATVERSDLEALFPWLEWGFQQTKQEFELGE
ncbi:MAG: phosphoserine transaminase [Myxococcales bacterium]|mgnify:CR=1 FL=1|nr:phosphoserine transaminase [Myxococcales bacterium]